MSVCPLGPPISRIDPTERVGLPPRSRWMGSNVRLVYYSLSVNMADNLNIKGIRDDDPPARRGKRSRGRKPFAIESRLMYPKDEHPNSIFRTLNLDGWWVHGRYETAARRDQAYAALVKKEAAGPENRWGYWEYRKLG